MKITFGLKWDGYQTVRSRQALEAPICGPLGLLQILETRLGLKAKTATVPRRVVQFQALLEHLAAERPVFYAESFKKDPYAVAETLLRWRDELIESGWMGNPPAMIQPGCATLLPWKRWRRKSCRQACPTPTAAAETRPACASSP